MIDTSQEDMIPLTAAGVVMPGRPSAPTLWRWAMRGSSGVKLETVCCGGRRFTSRAAIAKFIAAVTAVRNGELDPPEPQLDRRRRAKTAARKLVGS
jgi:uncharacterized protein DUF1580